MAYTLPRLTARPGSFGRRATGEDLGAAEGAARVQGAGVVSELAGTVGALVEADQSARVGRAVAQASSRMQELQASLEQDPSYEAHGKAWADGSRAILSETAESAGLLPGRFSGDFETRMTEIGARYGAQVRDSARRKQVDFARASLTEAGQTLGNLAARTADPDQREAFRAQHESALRDAVRGGLITFEDYQSRALGFDRGVSEADRRAAIAADPALAWEQMQDPENPLNRGLEESERQQWLAQAVTAQQQRLQDKRAAAAHARAMQERAEKEADEAAQREADDALAQNDLAAVQRASARIQDPEKRRWYLERLAEGGGFGSATTNRGLYADLLGRANAGDVVSEAEAAFRAGLLSRPDYEHLQKLSADKRFGEVEDYLKGSFQQGLFKFDQSQQVKNAEALRSFADWKLAHPEADRTEALTYARELIRWTGVQDLDGLPPGDAAVEPSAEAAGLLDLAAQGIIGADELDRRLAELEQREDAQRRAGSPK